MAMWAQPTDDVKSTNCEKKHEMQLQCIQNHLSSLDTASDLPSMVCVTGLNLLKNIRHLCVCKLPSFY